METSNCPECGEAVGGESHVLLAGNTRDVEMEDIARTLESNSDSD